jgi:hypothetical protein
MEPPRIARLIGSLEQVALRLQKLAPIVAVVILIAVIAFGVYALHSLFSIRTSPFSRGLPAPGVAPALERDRGVFEQLWTASTGPAQDLAPMRPDRGGPQQLLALSHSKVARFDLQGRLLTEIAAPSGTFRLAADPHGRLPFFLATSIEAYWSWKDLGRIAKANHLTAIDPQGRTLWTYTLPADRSSVFDVLLIDVDGGRNVEILVDVGARIVCLDTSGRELWSNPGEFRLWAQFDWQADGRPDVLFLKPSGRDVAITVLSPERQQVSLAILGRYSLLHAWHMARMARDSEATIATLAMSPTPNRDGKVPDILDVYSMGGAPIGRATLPWPTRPIGRRPLATVDTDGDGIRAWITAGDDGVLYLFSADARAQEAHHTGLNIRMVTVLPNSSSADWLVIGTERGLEVWRRRANFGSAVD